MSFADTETCTLPLAFVVDEIVAPLAGDIIVITGGVVSVRSVLLTLTEIEAVPIFPDES